jgi:hypothetical protein
VHIIYFTAKTQRRNAILILLFLTAKRYGASGLFKKLLLLVFVYKSSKTNFINGTKLIKNPILCLLISNKKLAVPGTSKIESIDFTIICFSTRISILYSFDKLNLCTVKE